MIAACAAGITACDFADDETGPVWGSEPWTEDARVPGTSYYLNQYVDNGEIREDIVYTYGNLPLVISVPHGGYYDPPSSIIPERFCDGLINNCARDKNSQEIARMLEEKITAMTGKYAHVIYNKLDRSKLDANREAFWAYNQCDNPRAETAWVDFQYFIDEAKKDAIAQYGRCLYIDLHGQRRTESVIIGYHMTSGTLDDIIADSDSEVIADSSLNLLFNEYLGKTIPFEELLRGANSLGTILGSRYSAYIVLPSVANIFTSIDCYYIGAHDAYNLNRHSVNTSFSGRVPGMQFELHGDNLYNDEFCAALAGSLVDFLAMNGFM